MSRTGALPSQALRALSVAGELALRGGSLADEKIQPASYDLTLGERAWCVTSTFLPILHRPVTEILERYTLYEFSLKRSAVFTVGSTYVVELADQLTLGPTRSGLISPKSSSGRINLWVRTMVDGHPRFDQVPTGYHGPIYAIITPKSWPVKVRSGDSLTQLRLFEGSHRPLQTAELTALHTEEGLIFDPAGQRIESTESLSDNAVRLTVDLEGSIAAYQAKHAIALIDLRKIKAHAADDFFTPIAKPKSGELALKEGEFYILPSYEYVRVPLDFAAEMAAYDVSAGEFRSHYAGFFDPGWGCTEDGRGTGAPIVLEVLPHETVILRHRQPISRAIYERLTEPSDRPYGSGVTSNYHGQRGPKLSKHFK